MIFVCLLQQMTTGFTLQKGFSQLSVAHQLFRGGWREANLYQKNMEKKSSHWKAPLALKEKMESF